MVIGKEDNLFFAYFMDAYDDERAYIPSSKNVIEVDEQTIFLCIQFCKYNKKIQKYSRWNHLVIKISKPILFFTKPIWKWMN